MLDLYIIRDPDGVLFASFRSDAAYSPPLSEGQELVFSIIDDFEDEKSWNEGVLKERARMKARALGITEPIINLTA